MNNHNQSQYPFEQNQSPEEKVSIVFHTRREERFASLMVAQQAQERLHPPLKIVQEVPVVNTVTTAEHAHVPVVDDTLRTLQELRFQAERVYDDIQEAA